MSKFEIVTIESMNIYRLPEAPTCGWLRDTEIAERAQLANPRDVRTHIKKLAGEGSISPVISSVAAADATEGPRFFIEKELVAKGNRGGTQEVDVFYLNEEAALLLIMRLRTPVAVELQRRIVRVFLAFTRGELAPTQPTRVIAPGADNYDRAIAQIDSLEAAGAINADTARLRRALVLKECTGIDLFSELTVSAFPNVAVIAPLQLGTGGAAIVPVVDTTGTKTATQVGEPYGLSARVVGSVADALGVRPSILAGETTYGVLVSVAINGATRNEKQPRYNAAAESLMADMLAAAVDAKRAKKKKAA